VDLHGVAGRDVGDRPETARRADVQQHAAVDLAAAETAGERDFDHGLAATETAGERDFDHGLAATETAGERDFDHGLAAAETAGERDFDHGLAVAMMVATRGTMTTGNVSGLVPMRAR